MSVTLICLGVISVVVLVLALVVVSKIRSVAGEVTPIVKALVKGLEDQEREIENNPKSVNAMTNVYLPIIQKDFPEFNYYEFKKKAENMLISAFNAISKEDTELIINGSYDLVQQIKSKITENREKNQKEYFQDVVIHETEIKNYVKGGGTCKITLQTSVGYRHYCCSPDGKVVSGSDTAKKQTRYDIDLVYVQDIDVFAYGENAKSLTCPNCGAPIKSLGEKNCPYCSSAVLEVNVRTWSINSYKEC